jgi:hypothetical protein
MLMGMAFPCKVKVTPSSYVAACSLRCLLNPLFPNE